MSSREANSDRAKVTVHHLEADDLFREERVDAAGERATTLLLVKHWRGSATIDVTIMYGKQMYPLKTRELPDPNVLDASLREFMGHFDSYSRAEADDATLEATARTILLAKAFEMLKALFDPDSLKVIRAWLRGSRLVISTTEGWIPWEILADGGDEFFSERFDVCRLPHRCTPKPADDISSRNTSELSKIVSIVGYGLDRHASTLAELFPLDPRYVSLTQPSIPELTRHFADADLVHITCHGHSTHLVIGKQSDPIYQFTPDLLGLESFRIKVGAIIFVNACSSNSPNFFFGGFTELGSRFYQKGAAVFIGTLGSVAVGRAVALAKVFYLELRSSGSILRAFQLARRVEPRIGMLYAFYGDPDLLCPVSWS